MAFEIGSRVGDYEILSVLGAGGMGQVYKVRNTISDRVEAMKILLPNLESEPELADRFLREIKVQASLVHPNIAQLHTAARVDNQLVMLMEFVEGMTLEQKLRQGPIGIRAAIDYITHVLGALSYAHSRGVVHRDIKPANMMLMPNGTVKLMDFGIAKAQTDRRLTSTGTTMGSLYYMSPEQIQGALDLDARADLYSVGISLYELVTGKRPFDGDSQFAIMSAHLEKQPVPPITLDATLPPALNDIILLSVAKNPDNRFQTAEAFRNALQSVVSGAGAGVGAAAAKAEPIAAKPAMAPAAPPKNRRGLYVAAGAVAMALALIAIVQFAPWRSTNASPAALTQTPTQTPVQPQTQTQTPPPQQAPAPAPQAETPTAQSQKPAAEPQREVPSPTRDSKRGTSPPPVVVAQNRTPVTPLQAPPPQTPPQAVPQTAAPEPQRQVAAPPRPDPAVVKELGDIRDALVKLEARAASARSAAARLQNQQAAGGLGMRSDAVQALNLMNNNMAGATQALNAGDAAAAKDLMRKAERAVETLEKIFNL